MPDPHCFWMVGFRPDSDDPLADISEKILPSSTSVPGTQASKREASKLGELKLPEFKTAPLSTLISLSETLAKQDPMATGVVIKILDTLRSLSSSQPLGTQNGNAGPSKPSGSVEDHLVMDDGRPYTEYLEQGWEWNKGKFRVESRKLEDIVDGLVKDIQATDNVHKQKLGNYSQAKGQLQQLQRKKTGNLAVRNVADVVSKEDFVDQSSEYLETLLVAVPKNNVKDWTTSYERICSFVVPRSSSKLAEDDEFTLFNVTVFRRAKDEFTQKCRERKFAVREFTYDEAAIQKAQKDLEELAQQEKELWSELLRLSRINFSEAFETLVHLKVIRTYIECLLRYGLPAHYFVAVLKPGPKQSKRLLASLVSYCQSLDGKSSSSKKKKSDRFKGANADDVVGEYAGLMEQEVFDDFVLYELVDPKTEGKAE